MGLTYGFNLTSSAGPFESNMLIKLRTIARNGVGYGAYSAVTTIHADSIPLRMNSPIEVKTDFNMIWISWTPILAWSDTGGDSIVYYQVEFLEKPCYANDFDDCTG